MADDDAREGAVDGAALLGSVAVVAASSDFKSSAAASVTAGFEGGGPPWTLLGGLKDG